MHPTRTRTIPLDRSLDLRLTLGPLVHGPADPTILVSRQTVVRATRTPAGPATFAVELGDTIVRAEAWGAGADHVLDRLPRILGLDDEPDAFRPAHPVLAALVRRLPGLRIGASGAVMESLVPAILEQKVTGTEAFRAFRLLVRRHGEPAPGPHGLWLQPPATLLAALPYYAWHPLGVEARRADTIRRAAARAERLEELVDLPIETAYRRLTSFAGIGPWTAAEVAARALGDADAVSVGDFHLPNLVAWALAGERGADDTRMLELLAPYAGQRGRAVRLLEAGGLHPPRHGPRMAPRSIAAI